MPKNLAYVFLNGELLGSEKFYLNFISENSGDFFCADGGFSIAKNLGLTPMELWGDMDSIDEKDLAQIISDGKIILRKFPVEKDFTDGGALVKYLTEQEKYEQIFIIGGLGGDVDHQFTNINLLVTYKYKKIIFLTERESIFYAEKNFAFKDLIGKKISFFPLSGSVENISLEGFKYPLKNYNLAQGDTICVGNIITNSVATVKYTSGDLICVKKN
ncbi:MAG: thiamine diphosphokinase [Fusobacteriaceae bacterium]